MRKDSNVGKLTKEYLCLNYLVLQKSQEDISKEIGCSSTSVSRQLEKYGLTDRSRTRKKKIFVGLRYGMSVICKEITKEDKSRAFEMLCDCGSKYVINHCSLYSVNSCGCLKEEAKKHNIICDGCGIIFDRPKGRCGGNNYCDHRCYLDNTDRTNKPIRDRVGEKHHKLTVIQHLGMRRFTSGRAYRVWLCLCDCGEHKEVSCSNLARTKSCGCLLKLPQHGHLYEPNRVLAGCKTAFRGYKKGAKSRGYVFELSFSEFSELLLGDCFYCGKGEANSGRYNETKVKLLGIDRKINSIGYLLENSVTCCKICNYAKGIMDIDDFLNLCERIVKNNEQSDNS